MLAPHLSPAPPGAAAGDPPAEGYFAVSESHPIRELVAVLRRHLWLALAVAAVVWGIGAYRILRTQPVFRATATVRLTDVRQELTGGISATYTQQQIGMYTDPMLSEIQVLRSRAVAAGAVNGSGARLRAVTPGFSVGALSGISVDPQVTPDTVRLQFFRDRVAAGLGTHRVEQPYGRTLQLPGVRFAVDARPSGLESAHLAVIPFEAATGRVLEASEAAAREGTDVVDIHFTDPDPAAAQRIANALALSFQETNARRSQEQSRRRRIFLEEQLIAQDSALAAAQEALSRFRSRERLYSSRERYVAEQSGVAGLDGQRQELLVSQRIYRSALAQLQRGGDQTAEGLAATPEIAGNPVIAGIYEQLTMLRARRDSLTTGAWARPGTDPDVQRLDGLISAARGRLANAVRQQLANVETRLSAIDAMRARGATEMQTLPATETEEVRLVQHVEGTRSLVNQLREQYQKARLDEAVEMGQVAIIEPATLPGGPVGTSRHRRLLFIMVIGLALGTGAAYLADRLNVSIRSRGEVEQFLRTPVLAQIPELGRSRGSGRLGMLGGQRGRAPEAELAAGMLPTVSSPDEPGAEAFRMLRTSLLFTQANGTSRTLAVTSSLPSEGKSTISANLAVTFAQHGMAVLLVDCDFRRARQQEIFGLDLQPGLSELVLDFCKPEEAIRPGPVPNLFLLPAGTRPPNPSELATSTRVRAVLREMAEMYDLVVIDTPPAAITAEATVLSQLADAVVVVLRAGSTDRETARNVLSRLRAINAPVVGAVLNDPDGKAATHGGYYGQYGYYYAYDRVPRRRWWEWRS